MLQIEFQSQYITIAIARADISGMGMLSSIGLYASVIVPTKAPINAGNNGSSVIALKKLTTKNAKLPSKLFKVLNGNLCLPNLVPIIVEAESPSKSINIPASAIAMLKLNIYSVTIIPIKKYKNPLSSSLLLQLDNIPEKIGI